MATTFQAGMLNTTALVVPGLYVGIQPPSNILLNGAPTDIYGLVGTATWGPVGIPVTCSGSSDYALTFGPVVNRKYDMGTYVAVGSLVGARDYRCVRVTDGTDMAAANAFNLAGGLFSVALASIYTGTLGNQIGATLAAGSKVGTFCLTVQLANRVPERFDNIAAPSVAAFWANLVAAVNQGNGALRGPSQLVTATLGTVTGTAPVPASFVLNGGTDGATAVTAAMLVGQDVAPRRGMYTLRKQAASVVALCDCDDSTQWTTMAAYGLTEGSYMFGSGPAGDTILNAIAVKQSIGLDTYAFKLMFGDWLLWNDQTNGVQRLVSPAAFAAATCVCYGPEQSTLNKRILGIIGSQKSGASASGGTACYSDAELQQLFSAGIDVIGNPSPGGPYWSVLGGFNASSDTSRYGDNYTRMTNYIATTIAAGMGIFVGDTVVDDAYFLRIRSTLLSLFQNMLQQRQLPSFGGLQPFSVQCDGPTVKGTNNPATRLDLGYVQADCLVRYAPINMRFVVNLQGGQTVSVTAAPDTGATQTAT